MARRTGSADLPLHGGHVPPWLATRMSRLGRVIVEAIVHHYGRDELLRRFAHPFWFQSFGAVMGMDWHSSGITTSVIGALKRGLAPLEQEIGVYVCGGKGAHSRKTPAELLAIGERTGLDGASLTQASRLVAKIDSAAVHDGFDLYLHSFIVTREGRWCVVQQGMNESRREARRYHWLSENLRDFFASPHAAIEGRSQGTILNLAHARAARNRQAELELVRAGPQMSINVLRRLRRDDNAALDLFADAAPELPHLRMPHRHDVRASDVMLKRLYGVLAAAADRGPQDFSELLLLPGVGARTVAALAFVAEVIHGAPARFSDPARFSLALGGKDGHPFPVPLHVYDETLSVLKRAMERAKLGNDDRLAAIKRLDAQARNFELRTDSQRFDTFVRAERAQSNRYGGRTVFDDSSGR